MARSIGLLLLIFALTSTIESRAAERVTIFAAASTTAAIQEIAKTYKEETGVTITPVFAASGALARQIDNGAPADIFLSADTEWTEWLAKRNRIDRRRIQPLLSNCLVLIEPAGESRPLPFDAALVERLGNGRLAIADPALAPLGAHARAALRAQGLWHRVRKQIVLQPNARATLALVARGEAAAGIVYQSDSQSSAAVRMAARIPASLHGRIVYPVVPVGGFISTPAMHFLAHLQRTAAILTFERFGFIQPGTSCSD
jgi:molybdate transport system substrate-binding protein